MLSAKHIFGDLAEVKAAVRAKTDAIPFLLLPVRIETRFVTQQNPPAGVQMENWYISLAEIGLAFLEPLPKSQTPEAKQIFTAQSKKIHELRANISRQQIYTRHQQQELLKLSIRIQSYCVKVLPSLKKIGLEGEANIVEQEMLMLRNLVESLPKEKDASYSVPGSVVAKMNNLHAKLKQVIGGYLPYTTPKNKKKLYKWLTRLQSEIRFFYRTNNDLFEHIKIIEKEQALRIEKVHKEGFAALGLGVAFYRY